MSTVSPFLLELQWFFNILFHTNLTLSPFKLFSVFIINLGKDYFFFWHMKKNMPQHLCSSQCPKSTYLAVFSQVFAKSELDPASLKLIGIFQCHFILFYFTQCCSYQVSYICFWFTALWDEQGLWLLVPWHQAGSNMWAIYSMHALLGVTWLHIHKKINNNKKKNTTRFCSYTIMFLWQQYVLVIPVL